MAYERITDDLDVIVKLDDEPNDIGGLSPEELKAKFDEAGNAIKTYINETLLPAMEGENGAENIGIAGISQISTATNVQDALILICQLINDISQGAVPDGSIGALKLADAAVTAAKIALSAVNSGNIIDSAVITAKLADLCITTAKLAAKCVTSSKIADGAVGATQIADGAVVNAKLGASAVQSNNIYEKAVSNAKLADDCITNDKLADNAVDTENIVDLSITADKIVPGAVGAYYTASIDTTWTGSAAPFTKDVSIVGMTEYDHPLYDIIPDDDPDVAELELDEYAKIYKVVADTDKVTLYAFEKTTRTINMEFGCVRR